MHSTSGQLDNGDDLLASVVAAAREMSRHDDPQAVLEIAMSYSRRIVGYDRTVAATRRDLSPPMIRLMRSPLVDEQVDPWKQSDALPVISGGLLAELVYAGAPRVIDELSLAPDDPAAAHLAGMRSLAAIPHFDDGEALDMVFHVSHKPGAFARDRLGQMVLLSSMFGQAVWDSVRARDLVEAEQSMKEQYDIIAQVSNTVLDEALHLKDHSRELEERVRQRTAELAEANLETIYMLAVASEAKDEDTGQHVRRIQRLARSLALQVGMTEAEADALGLAAMLHDVGKIHIPDSILKKPGPLTPQERAAMQEHTLVGERILRDSPYFASSRRIARSHHENFDGSGYPDGMSGEKIPLEARIVHLADVYDALISPRVYKLAWPRDEAAAFVRKSAGRMFDPELVKAFDSAVKKSG